MCIMLTKPANVKLNYDALEECYWSNSDGCGFTAALPSGVLVTFRDHQIKFKPFWDKLQCHMNYPMLIHFRQATDGGVNHENTHPFIIGKGDYAMGHNGIIRCPMQNGESDTRAFIRLAITPYIDKHPALIEDPKWQEYAKNSFSNWNKLAFIRKDGEFFYVNKSAGVEEMGCWWSNTQFRRARQYSSTKLSKPSVGFQQALLDTYDNEYELADAIYNERQRLNQEKADKALEESLDKEGAEFFNNLFEERTAAAEKFLLEANPVHVEDAACVVCNEYCEIPYILDADTGDAMCMNCKDTYAKEWNLNDTIDDEEQDDATTGPTTVAAITRRTDAETASGTSCASCGNGECGAGCSGCTDTPCT